MCLRLDIDSNTTILLFCFFIFTIIPFLHLCYAMSAYLIFQKFSLIILQYIAFYVHNYIYLYSFLLKKILNFLLHYHVIACQIFSLSVLLCILFLFRIYMLTSFLYRYIIIHKILYYFRHINIPYSLGIFKVPSTILFCRDFFNIGLSIFVIEDIPSKIIN